MVAQGRWRSFVSRGTIISGLLALLFWGLTVGWVPGSILVALLYIHELGHILAARARKMTIRGAPIFIPGLGAFVRVDPTANIWDDVLMVLGGPVIGGAVALLAGVAGIAWQIPALSFAGSFGLLLNLANLLPIAPLDGGRLAARTGWFGFTPTLFIGIALIAVLLGGGANLLVGLIACLVLYWGYRTMRSGHPAPWTTQGGVFLLHITAATMLSIAYTIISRGEDRFIPSGGQIALPSDMHWSIQGIGLVAAALIGLSTFAWRIAFRPGCDRNLRYLLLALVCWPSFLFGHPRVIPGMWCLLAQRCGLPGLTWLTAYIRRLAAGGHLAAAFLCAYGYDFQRNDEAEVWLDALLPTIRATGERAVLAAANTLSMLGHRGRAFRWVVSAYDGVALDALSFSGLAMLAAGLCAAGRVAEGLPYARAAVATNRHAATLGALGEVLHELDQQDEAAEVLQESLRLIDFCRHRLVLAKVFGAQGRYAEAIAAADHVLHAHDDSWFQGRPTATEVRGWIEGWLIAAAQGNATPDQQAVEGGTPDAELVAR